MAVEDIDLVVVVGLAAFASTSRSRVDAFTRLGAGLSAAGCRSGGRRRLTSASTLMRAVCCSKPGRQPRVDPMLYIPTAKPGPVRQFLGSGGRLRDRDRDRASDARFCLTHRRSPQVRTGPARTPIWSRTRGLQPVPSRLSPRAAVTLGVPDDRKGVPRTCIRDAQRPRRGPGWCRGLVPVRVPAVSPTAVSGVQRHGARASPRATRRERSDRRGASPTGGRECP